jgi:hypothetical protein
MRLNLFITFSKRVRLLSIARILKDSSLVCDIRPPNGRFDNAPIILPGPVSEVGGIRSADDVYVLGMLKTKNIVIIETIKRFLIIDVRLFHSKGIILIILVSLE